VSANFADRRLFVDVETHGISTSQLVIYSPPGTNTNLDGKPLALIANNKMLTPGADWTWNPETNTYKVTLPQAEASINLTAYYTLSTSISSALEKTELSKNETAKIVLIVNSEYEFPVSIQALVNDSGGNIIDDVHFDMTINAGSHQYLMTLGTYGEGDHKVLLTVTDETNNIQIYSGILVFTTLSGSLAPPVAEFNSWVIMVALSAITMISILYKHKCRKCFSSMFFLNFLERVLSPKNFCKCRLARVAKRLL
jgi:hypothetical protein